MGYIEVINMPTDHDLFAIDLLVGHAWVVWINDKAETGEVSVELPMEEKHALEEG